MIRAPVLTFSLLLTGLSIVSPGDAILQGRPCMDAAFAAVNGGQTPNCTANDLTFLAFDLGVQDDGCVGAGDSTEVILRSVVSNTTAQTRYDVGLWFNTDGSGSARTGGACAVDSLSPVGPLGSVTCPPLNLAGPSPAPGHGPFLNADGDVCGDLLSNGTSVAACDRVNNTTLATGPDGLRDPAVTDFDAAVTFSCSDADQNGFLEIPACLSYGQQNNEVGGATCDGIQELVPGTKAKCQCLTLVTTITVPNLQIPQCTCAAQGGTASSDGGGFSTCSVSYSNPIPAGFSSCNPDPSKPVRSRCRTASFIQFQVDDSAGGSYTTTSSEATGGSFLAIDPNRGQTDPTTGASMTGIVPEGDTGTIDFTYSFPQGTTGTVTLDVDTYYYDKRCSNDFGRRCAQNSNCTSGGTCSVYGSCSNSPGTACTADTAPARCGVGNTCVPSLVQQPTVSCDVQFDVAATWASVSSFTAERGIGGVEVRWETAAEAGTAGFDLYRSSPDGRWTKVNDDLILSVQHPAGGTYRVVDREVPYDALPTYRLEEIALGGERQDYGPIATQSGLRGPRSRPARQGDVSARRHAPTARTAATGSVDRAAGKASKSGPSSSDRARIEVDREGLHHVSNDAIAAALGRPSGAVAADVSRGRIRLSEGGETVAYLPTANGILFFGRRLETLYTGTNVYWIERGDGALVRAGEGAPNGTPRDATWRHHLTLEQNLFSWHEITSEPESDIWFWATLLAGHRTIGTVAVPFDLPDPAPVGADAELTVALWGWTGSPSYEVEVLVGGTSLGTLAWTGQNRFVGSLPMPHDLLRAPGEVRLVAREGGVLVDELEFAYDRRYRALAGQLLGEAAPGPTEVRGFPSADIRVWDVSDPRQPRAVPTRITPTGEGDWSVSFELREGAPFLAAVDSAVRVATPAASARRNLTDPARRAEYLVITPAELLPGAEELARYRESRGLESEVITLESIYDEINHGVRDPRAVQRFLARHASRWDVPPRYLALIGTGHFDYREYRGFGGNLFPPLLAPGGKGLVPADNRYGDFDGNGLPEIAVGRIPVADAPELDRYVERLRAYEAGRGEAWRDRVLLLSDNADGAGDFPTSLAELSTRVPGSYQVDTVVLGGSTDLGTARERLLSALDSGVFAMGFVGHGGLDRLASEGLLTKGDLAGLRNADRPPVVLGLTCTIGLFAIPGYSCLAEEMLVQEEGGAIAVLGPTGLSFNWKAVQLGKHLVDEILAPIPGRRLGDTMLEAMGRYLVGGGDASMLRVYNLFGDPALELRN